MTSASGEVPLSTSAPIAERAGVAAVNRKLRTLRRVSYVLSAILTIAIFWLDVSSPLMAAEEVLYMIVVLLSVSLPGRASTITCAWITSLLVIIGLFVSAPGDDVSQAIANRGLALVVLWATAVLVLQRKAIERLQLETASKLEAMTDSLETTVEEKTESLRGSYAKLHQEMLGRIQAEREVARLRDETRRLDRLADLGALTAKIVHDLGNPISGLSLLLQRLRRRIERQPEQPASAVQEMSEQAVALVERLSALVLEFKGRSQPLRIESIALEPFLEEVRRLWETEAEARRITLVVGPVTGTEVDADRAKLRRVLDNLIKNALEAIQEGPGLVSLSAHGVDGSVRISVADSGPGFPENAKPFALFETTKENGTGLGLTICKQIAEAHGGGIRLAKREPNGTVASIDLPGRGHSL